MFCKNCGKEIPNDSKFCPECGATLASIENAKTEKVIAESPKTTYNPAAEKEVYIRGFKYASERKNQFSFLLTTLPTLLQVLSLIILFFNFGLGFVLLFCATLYYFVARVIFKQSILYNSDSKEFIYNEHSKVQSTRQSLNIKDLKSIRFRYVKVNYNACMANGIDMGKYHVITFDATDDEKSFSVWFPKAGNAEEFLPIIETALADNNSAIKIDKKEDLVNIFEFAAEEI